MRGGCRAEYIIYVVLEYTPSIKQKNLISFRIRDALMYA